MKRRSFVRHSSVAASSVLLVGLMDVKGVDGTSTTEPKPECEMGANPTVGPKYFTEKRTRSWQQYEPEGGGGGSNVWKLESDTIEPVNPADNLEAWVPTPPTATKNGQPCPVTLVKKKESGRQPGAWEHESGVSNPPDALVSEVPEGYVAAGGSEDMVETRTVTWNGEAEYKCSNA